MKRELGILMIQKHIVIDMVQALIEMVEKISHLSWIQIIQVISMEQD